MENKNKKLIIFVCVICLVAGVFYINIIQQHQWKIKSKMTEVTNAMSNVARAVEAYNQDLNSWPHCDGVLTIQNSLGYTLSKQTIDRISAMTVTSSRAEEVMITATIKGIHSEVDGKNLTLTGKRSERNILWRWGGTVPSTYEPKK